MGSNASHVKYKLFSSLRVTEPVEPMKPTNLGNTGVVGRRRCSRRSRGDRPQEGTLAELLAWEFAAHPKTPVANVALAVSLFQVGRVDKESSSEP